MGVTNLWALLEPCGRRIDVQALRGKRVAVDASGWIFKFIKAMRDDQGELLPNAHLIGFFRRICKLLFHNIRPIFIFDGSTPALKRQTVIERRRRREQQEARVKKTAEKLLLNRLKQHALAQAAAAAQEAEGPGPSSAAANQTQTLPPQPASDQPTEEAGPSAAAAAAAPEMPKGTSTGAEIIAIDDSSSDSEPDFEPLLPEGDGPVDPVVLSTLPPSMQLEIMLRLRDRQMAANRGGFEERTGKPEAFSEFQINQYLKTSNLRRQLDTLRGTGSGANGVARPVAAEEAREYVLERDEDLEKLEKGRRGAEIEQAEGVGGSQGGSGGAAAPTAPATEGLKLSFEINKEEIMSDDSLVWEDVEGDAGGLGGSGGSGGKEGEHWRERAARRQKYWSLSHGFQMGRKLAQWGEGDEEGDDGAGRSPVRGGGNANENGSAGIVEEDEDAQLQEAIRRSLMPAGDEEMQVEAAAAETAAVAGAKQVVEATTRTQQVEEFVLVQNDEEVMWEDVVTEPNELVAAVATKRKEAMGANSGEVQEKESARDQEVEIAVKEAPTSVAVEYEAPLTEALPVPPQPSLQEPLVDIAVKVPERTKFQQKQTANAAIAPEFVDTAVPAVADASVQQLEKQRAPLEECSQRVISVAEEPASQTPQAQEMEADGVDGDLVSDTADQVVEVAEKASLSAPAAAVAVEEESAAAVESDDAVMDDDAIKALLDNLAGPPQKNYQSAPPQEQLESRAAAAVPAALLPTAVAAPGPQKEAKTVRFAPEVDEFERLVAEAEHQHFEEQEEEPYSPPLPPAAPADGPSSAPAPPAPESSSQPQRQPLEDMLTSAWTDREGLPSFDPERLQREEAGLRAEHRAAAGQSDTPTDVMYAECQQLLQLFGLPYLIAPSEAEAQAAWLDAAGLVDGVVTDDNDAFLFGAQNLYRNIFENAKYVEEYRSSDLESELGLNRQRLVLMALLLGSDYTAGVSGVGVVNAVEIVHAFQGVDGLERFAKWMNGVDEEILKLAKKAGGAGGDDATNQDAEEEQQKEVAEEEHVDGERAEVEAQFKKKHKNVRKSWNLPNGFPSREVVNAYLEPKIDDSKEKFTFARPDLDLLRRFCLERFGWDHSRTDELLLPVLKAYDARQTQQTLDNFVAYRQRFAKIRSKRLRQAVAGITGASNDEIALGEEEGEPQQKKKAKRRKKAAAGAGKKGKGRKKGSGSGEEEEKEIVIGSSSSEDDDEVMIVEDSPARNRGRGRGCGRGAGGRATSRPLPRRSKQSQQKQANAGQNNE